MDDAQQLTRLDAAIERAGLAAVLRKGEAADLEYSTFAIAARVIDLVDERYDHLTKRAFARLAIATGEDPACGNRRRRAAGRRA